MAARSRWTSIIIREFAYTHSGTLADTSGSNGLNWRPQPFPCRFTPRSEEIKQAIEREGRDALQSLAIYDGESERVAEVFKPKKQEA